jgi:hypothetical protein
VGPFDFSRAASAFANECGDRFTTRKHAADDLAAHPAGGADHCGGQRVAISSSAPSGDYADA